MAQESGRTAGRALKRIFKQDDILGRIRQQPASFSLLMNPTRLNIFIYLCQNPCDHTRSIARNIGSLTTVNWHLKQLLEHGYVEAKVVNQKKLYWPKGMLLDNDLELIGCMRKDLARKIIGTISQKGEIRQKEIVKTLGVRQQNIDFWLLKMMDCGLIVKKGQGIGATYAISKESAKKVKRYDEKARAFSMTIMQLLHNDGLMPEKKRYKGTRLSVQVNLPDGKRRIHIECSPMAAIRRYVR